MKSKTESGSGWYPGKFIKERRASKTAKACGPESSVSNSSHGPSLGSISEGDPSQGATAGRGPTRRGYGPERSVGQVSVKILETRFVTATKPVLEVSLQHRPASLHPLSPSPLRTGLLRQPGRDSPVPVRPVRAQGDTLLGRKHHVRLVYLIHIRCCSRGLTLLRCRRQTSTSYWWRSTPWAGRGISRARWYCL